MSISPKQRAKRTCSSSLMTWFGKNSTLWASSRPRKALIVSSVGPADRSTPITSAPITEVDWRTLNAVVVISNPQSAAYRGPTRNSND